MQLDSAPRVLSDTVPGLQAAGFVTGEVGAQDSEKCLLMIAPQSPKEASGDVVQKVASGVSSGDPRVFERPSLSGSELEQLSSKGSGRCEYPWRRLRVPAGEDEEEGPGSSLKTTGNGDGDLDGGLGAMYVSDCDEEYRELHAGARTVRMAGNQGTRKKRHAGQSR